MYVMHISQYQVQSYATTMKYKYKDIACILMTNDKDNDNVSACRDESH